MYLNTLGIPAKDKPPTGQTPLLRSPDGCVLAVQRDPFLCEPFSVYWPCWEILWKGKSRFSRRCLEDHRVIRQQGLLGPPGDSFITLARSPPTRSTYSVRDSAIVSTFLIMPSLPRFRCGAPLGGGGRGARRGPGEGGREVLQIH